MALVACVSIFSCTNVFAVETTTSTNAEVSNSVETAKSGYYTFNSSTGKVKKYYSDYSALPSWHYAIKFDASTKTILEYDGRGGINILPDIIEDVEVTCIGKNAFYKSSISTLVLPSSLEIIQENSFKSCNKLKKYSFQME